VVAKIANNPFFMIDPLDVSRRYNTAALLTEPIGKPETADGRAAMPPTRDAARSGRGLGVG
jgi:hypothetical protein